MKYAVVHFEYHEGRTGNPFLFTVQGTPDTKAEWEQFGGKTRQTMTLAEIEAKGITLPAAFASATADSAKLIDSLRAQLITSNAAVDDLKARVRAVLES